MNNDLSLTTNVSLEIISAMRKAKYGVSVVPPTKYPSKVKVFNKQAFQLADGTVIKANTDITKYFVINYSRITGYISSIKPNKNMLDIMNLPVNKKVAQSFYCLF